MTEIASQGDTAPAGSPGQTVVATVCFVRKEGRILLQRRAAGRLWAGRLNGPGGKLLPNETPENGIIREVAEETGLTIERPTFHGTVDLDFGVPVRTHLFIHVFVATHFRGRATGNREGVLRWYSGRRLPFDQMWPDMTYWLPIVLDGGTVDVRGVYDAAGDRLLSCSLKLAWQAT